MASSCASAPKSYVITPESVNPVAISELSVNKQVIFFKYAKNNAAVNSMGVLGKMVNAATKKMIGICIRISFWKKLMCSR